VRGQIHTIARLTVGVSTIPAVIAPGVARATSLQRYRQRVLLTTSKYVALAGLSVGVKLYLEQEGPSKEVGPHKVSF
jgi:hypothetical protein